MTFVLKLLIKKELLSINQVYTDGDNAETNANKQIYLSKKLIENNKENVKK